MSTAEHRRLREARTGIAWRKWGPYVSERQWGTVREDYSDNGDAWAYLSHEQSRSRAYRWGEDGIAGICDEQQRLCFALAMWNERDPILKERLFGLTNSEGNHGEDVKEYYFYVDNVPTHSYQRFIYKYPQGAFPYENLIRTNGNRSRYEYEYELIDTGVFADNRYFDVEVEYAKSGPEDLLCRITVHNRGPLPAAIHLAPTLWFRNTWSWTPGEPRPTLNQVDGDHPIIRARHELLGQLHLHGEPGGALLFCENETNAARLFGGQNATPFVKDGINDFIVANRADAVNPAQAGTKAAVHARFVIPPGESVVYRLRLTAVPAKDMPKPFAGFDALIAKRRAEADEFYASITPPNVTPDSALVMRQALAGMLWSKQFYSYDLDTWLREHHAHPLRAPTRHGLRNESWFHMTNHDVISMPDKWEYPWYAAWDLAFHTVPLDMIDPDFARSQLNMILSPQYQHPSGQVPAYEWNFGDVNPPVQAFATLFLHRSGDHGEGLDIGFLKDAFAKLLLNFTWWVNRKDPNGRNVFEGGFLGLDNIGVFDRSAALPTGGHLEQSDGTAWMALFSQNMLELALILAEHDPTYEDFVLKFVERFFWIAASIDPSGDNPNELWDREDGFFYDVLRMPDGRGVHLKVRSLVGLLPMCATTVMPDGVLARFPRIRERVLDFLKRNGDLLTNIADPLKPGVQGRHILSLVNEDKLRKILERMLDENCFLGPYGIRSISREHAEHPYSFWVDGREYKVQYEPAESTTGMFGGNSNWRGPVWFPINVVIIRALLQHYTYLGDSFTIECPTRSGNRMTLFEVAKHISDRLIATFQRGADGRRPVFGGAAQFQNDPHWRDLVLFYEYFHGDNGAGLGASHQTGWTGIVAKLIQMNAQLDAKTVLQGGPRILAVPYRMVGS
jgi:hypothetical protein